MFSFDFHNKLQRLNHLLYVTKGPRVSSLMLTVKKHADVKSDYNYLDRDAAKLLQAQESGYVDEFVCGVPNDWIPEHDEIDIATGKIIKRGWRIILKTLIEKKICSLDRAKKVFSCPSLLESDWDRMSLPQRIERLRADAQR